MVIWRSLGGISILLLTASIVAPQTQEPDKVWNIVRDMLSAPNGQAVFTSTLKGAVIAGPGGLARYLQGSVISIIPDKAGTRRLLLSMEGSHIADVTIVLSGPNARLKNEPKKGDPIRFEAVAKEFTKEPFMVTIQADHLTGLDFVNPQAAPFPSSN
jgi:hypothetical protein